MSKPKHEELRAYKTVERWLTYVSSTGIRSKATEKIYLYFLNRFCEFTSKTPEELIEERKQHLQSNDEAIEWSHEELLDKWINSMEQDPIRPLARGSVVTGHNIIKSFYQANRVSLLRKSPKFWKTKPSSSVVPTLEELAKIVEKAKNPRDKAIIMCLAQSGISLEDFVEIRYGKIRQELEAGVEPLHVPMERHKIGHYKYDTFFGADAIKLLKEYLKEQPLKDDDLLFDISPRAIEYMILDASTKAGMKIPITPHRFRAFFSTYLGLSFHTTQAKHIPLIDYWQGHKLPYNGTYMVPPLEGSEGQRQLYRDHEYAISIEKQMLPIMSTPRS